MYDYVIIGAGPTGLTLAWCLAQYNKKVLIVERENEIGGCHRVRRVDGLFTEHGPRIYLGNSKTFKFILDDMNLSFDALFSEYKFNTATVGNQIIKLFKINELITLAKEYLYFIIRPAYSKTISMDTLMNDNNFTQPTKDFVDKLCRITDGAGSDRYTLYEFCEIINQNIFYGIYIPKLPNDVGLFKQWGQALKNTGNVDIWLNSTVDYINNDANTITSVRVIHDDVKTNMQASNYIFAIPPKSLLSILSKNSAMHNAYGNYKNYVNWEKRTEYLLFIPIVFHWNVKLNVEVLWGVPASDWGIGSIVLSNYMNFLIIRILIRIRVVKKYTPSETKN